MARILTGHAMEPATGTIPPNTVELPDGTLLRDLPTLLRLRNGKQYVLKFASGGEGLVLVGA
jgi:hypothetical protein